MRKFKHAKLIRILLIAFVLAVLVIPSIPLTHITVDIPTINLSGVSLHLPKISLDFKNPFSHEVRAAPTDAYWVGDSGNWSDATNHWATSTGGSPGAGNLPDATTSVHFDGSSFTNINKVVTVDANAYCDDIIWTGALYNPKLSFKDDFGLFISGSMTLISAMTVSQPQTYYGNYLFYFNSTSAETVDTAGITTSATYRYTNFAFNGAGSWTLLSPLVVTGQKIALTQGTLNTNGQTITCGEFNSSNTNARALTLGASTIYCTSWNIGTSTFMTFSGASSTINDTGDFSGGGLTYNIVNSTGLGSSSATISGNNIFTTFAIPRYTKTISFTAGSTQTATTFSFPISGTTVLTMNSTSGGSAWYLVQASGTVGTNYLSLRDSHASGGAGFFAGAQSTDVSGNLGWVFHTPPTVATTSATTIHSTSALLQGNVTVNSYTSYVYFEYATDAYYTGNSSTYSTTTAEQTKTSNGLVTKLIVPLTNTTLYHYRIAVRFTNGGSDYYDYGADATFTTINTPDVVTDSAVNVTTTSATIQGSLTYLASYTPVSVFFQYGTTISYSNSTTAQSETAITGFWTDITGLIPNVTYHYRAVVSYADASSPVYGADVTFATTAGTGSNTTIQINSVNLFNDYQTSGDLLVVAEIFNKYTGYYPFANAAKTFVVELLGTDDTTIIAVSPLQMWGDRPESIYLSPTLAATLTQGAAYHLAVVGLMTSPPTPTDYTIQPEDWQGSDLINLDTWLISTARDMETYDNVTPGTYVMSSTQNGDVITDTAQGSYYNAGSGAGGYFTTGIPNIATVRPNKFQVSSSAPIITTGTANNAYATNHVWATQVGSEIASDWNSIGAIAGVSGDKMMGYGIAVAMMILSLMGMAMGGKGLPMLVLCWPLGLWGVAMGAIGIQMLIVPAIAMVMFWGRQFWVKPT